MTTSISHFRTPGRGLLAFCFALLAMVLLATGCEEQAPSKSAAVTPPVTPPAQSPTATQPSSGVQVGSERNEGVDTQDAQDSPRALPRSGQVGGWIKSRPVRILTVDQAMAQTNDDFRRAALKLFRLKQVATCEYQLGSARAEVLFIEADPSDALSLFTVMTESPTPILQPDGSMRGRGVGTPQVLTAWQGSVFVQVAPDGVLDEKAAAKADQLISRIVFALPSSDPPLLTRVIPRERRDRCRLWVTRTAEALRLVKLEAFKSLAAEEVNRELGLGANGLLTVAAVDVVPGEPHLIWVVEYATPEQASEAHVRCSEAMKNPKSALDRTLTVESPRGAYLAGTWTRQQEALQPLLPVLIAALPEPEPPATRPAAAPAAGG